MKSKLLFSLLLSAIIANECIAQQNDSLRTDSLNLQRNIVPQGDIRETNPLVTGNELIQADFPGSWPMFGTNMRMKIGGYVKADFLYDVDGTLDRTQFLMSTIPVEGTPEHDNHGYVNFFSRETRFNIDVRRVKGPAPLKMFLEADFWSTGNQLRLRHAYITVGNFIVGQTWTTLSFLESMPFIIDFAAGDALFGGRTTQVRFQKSLNKGWVVAAAIEKLDFMGIENPNSLDGEASEQLPLLALRLDRRWHNGVLFLGTSAGQLRWDGGSTGPEAHALQLDLVIAGRQYIGKNNFVTWNFSIGKGSGENIMAFAGSQANAVLTASGELETMRALSALLGVMHKWNDKVSSNFSYAYGWLDTPPSRDPLALKRGGVGHVNLIWRPVTQFSTGIEYMWGAQRVTNDGFGSASRIQAMVKYDF